MTTMTQPPTSSNFANFDPANNLWGNNPMPATSTTNPLSPSVAFATPSNLNSFGGDMNPASPGSIGAMLNPDLLYQSSTNSSGIGATCTPSSSTGVGSGTSPNSQQSGPGGTGGTTTTNVSNVDTINPNGPFMGNPESSLKGSSNRNIPWTNWSAPR